MMFVNYVVNRQYTAPWGRGQLHYSDWDSRLLTLTDCVWMVPGTFDEQAGSK